MTCDESRERFVDALYEARDDELAAHLAGCPSCAAEFAALKETLTLMSGREKVEGPGDRFWERLAARLAAPEASGDGQSKVANRADQGREAAVHFPPPRAARRHPAALPSWAYGIAAVLLLAAGIYLGGKYFAPPAPAGSPATASHETAPSSVRPLADSTAGEARAAASGTRASRPGAPRTGGSPAHASDTLDAHALAYLERTRNLLLGIVNADEARPAELARAQETSRRLVNQSRYLQAALTEPDQQQMKRLILELEVILLQLANVETAPGTPAVELVRQGVDTKSILLKINLEEMRAAASRPKQGRKHTI